MQRNETTTSTVLLNGEQAKTELDALDAKAKDLRKSLREATKLGDLEGMKRYNRELQQTQKQMRTVRAEAFDAKKVLDNLSGASLRDLHAAQKKIDALMRNGTVARHSREWNELRDANTRVRAEIQNVNREMNLGQSRMSRFTDGFNKYFGAIGAGIAMITGLTLGLKKFMDMSKELEDAQANLQALTGLAKEDIGWLTEEAKVLSTEMTDAGIRIRQSSKDIIDAYTLVGSAKPELLSNKQALRDVTEQTLILATASKMDLTAAVNGVTMAMNQYSAGADQAARFTNVLAAGSKFGAANVQSITAAVLKSGVSAAAANINIEQLVGTIETIGEFGIKDEIAGTGLKKFFLTLQTGADDTNPKVVGLAKALENLANKNLSAADTKKMFGEEGYNVASVLINNTAKVDYYTKAVTGTNIAMEQATINSGTLAAKMEQSKNKMAEAGMEFVQTLNPAILTATNFTTKFMKLLVALPKWLQENKVLVSVLATAVLAYAIAVNKARIANIAATTAEKLKLFWTKASIASQYLHIAVTGYLTGATRVANLATKQFYATLGLNPLVAIAAGITAVVYGLYKLSTRTTESQKAFAEFNKEAHIQTTELNNIFEAYKKANPQSAEKARLLNIIKEKYGPYIKDLIDEKGHIIDIEKAQKQANAALRESIALKVRDKYIADSTANEVEQQAALMLELRKRIARTKGTVVADELTLQIGEALRNNIDNVMTTGLDKAKEVLKKNDLFDGAIDRREFSQIANNLASSYYRIGMKTKEFESVFKGLIGDANTVANTLDGTTPTNDITPGGTPTASKYEDEEKRLENSMKNQLLMLKELFREKIITEGLYNKLSEQLSITHLEDKIKLQKQYKKDSIDTEISLSDARLKQLENEGTQTKAYKKALDDLNKIELAAVKEDNPVIDAENYTLALRLKILEAFHAKGLSSEEQYLEQLAELYKNNQAEINKYLTDQNLKRNQEEFDKGIIGRKQYLDNTKQITRQYYDERFAKETDFAEKSLEIAHVASQFVQSLAEAETMAIDNKYAKQLDAARKAGQDTTQLEEQIEQEKKEVKKKYADVEFAITSGKIIAETALAIMKAAPNIPLQVATGLLGGAQLLVANQQRESIKNLWTGGYTGAGGKYEPKGIVHGNEFVANMDATGNRSLRKIFNLVDHAQRTNTVARIDDRAIAQVIGSSRGFAQGGYTTPQAAPQQAQNNDYSELLALVQQTMSINSTLISVLENGIEANVSVSGNNGIKQATDKYNKLIKNAKR